jgi:hypothetical protein
MSTVRDLITGSLRLIGAVATGETPEAQELTDALGVLNQMIDSWSLERLTIYSLVAEEFALVAGTQRYSLGTGGTFNTSRPTGLQTVTIKPVTSGTAYESPVDIIGEQQWAAITQKTTQSVPNKVYPEGTYPLEYLNFYPCPDQAHTVVLWSAKPLTTFAAIGDTVAFPPGYLRALRYNLAIELAPEYGKPISQQVAMAATESKENIKRRNFQPALLQSDPAMLGPQRTFIWLVGG